MIELADKVGLDVFGTGEYHRAEFLDSAPVVILPAAATRTENILLTGAVTVLSASAPIRVFQEFAIPEACARRLLAAGVSRVVSRELTGHRTSAMFDRYAIVSSADVLAAQTKVAEFRKQA